MLIYLSHYVFLFFICVCECLCVNVCVYVGKVHAKKKSKKNVILNR